MNAVLFALLCVIWGSTWLVIKVGYGGLGPFNVAALRFFVAAAILAVVTPVIGARWPRGRTEWALATWVGVLLFAGDYGLIYWGEQYLTSGLTAILFATLPLITLVLAHNYLPSERLTVRKATGAVVAFLGVVALFGERARIDVRAVGPMASIIGAAACAAAANVATKRHGASLHPAALNASAMLIGAIVLATWSVAVGDGFRFPAERSAWLAILYLSVIGSVVAFLVYFSLMKKWRASTLSFVGVFMPTIALLLGAIVLHEPLTRWTIVGAVLILAGVTLTLAPARPAETRRTSAPTIVAGTDRM